MRTQKIIKTEAGKVRVEAFGEMRDQGCADRITDAIWNGEIKGDMDHPYGEPGCMLWTAGEIEVYELRDDSGSLYGYGAYSDAGGYQEALLKHSFNRRDALRCVLIKVTSED